MSQERCCGYVAIVGAPNAGKSTLLNALVGQKVTIVSPKIQTTRNKILAIALEEQTQIIFLDTPGIFSNPNRKLERSMVHEAWASVGGVDTVLVVMDVAKRKPCNETYKILDVLVSKKLPIILVLNKIDLVPKPRLLEYVESLKTYADFERIFLISAYKNDGVTDILAYLRGCLPAGPWLFPADQVSDVPSRFLAAEVTREHLFRCLFDELPYSLYVETEKWERFRNGSIKISQAIIVQRESQKSIVLGQNGRQIQKIGMRARQELQDIFSCPVHLFLHVKVKQDWDERPSFYKEHGLEFKL